MKIFFSLLRETFRQWDAHRVPKMGAALSFYTVFSLAPLAILVLSLVSLAVERDAARAEIVGQFRNFVGHEGAEVMEMILTKTGVEHTGILGTVIGFVVLLIGASGVFGELQDSLNQIWGVSSKRHPVFILVKERVFSFAMVFVMGFLMLVSFMFSAAIAAAGNYLHGRYPGLDGPWEWGNAVISLLVIALLFALIFRLVPDARITWRDVWPGALIAAVLFEVGKFILGFYFGRSAIASSYGAAGSLIIILVWVFYSAQILFFGAAFTRVYAMRFGSHRDDEAAVIAG
ncbi:YihY/virulence factor BrkB family protein [Prosthecobacter sp.]|uniref:YihY/virulence factor BrkB family protein n=1 Tax=Prosthecobacter sp. TaxID=1965333 RepID=UPI002ABB0AC1|nr:YihY/virulence factor BrkB family protein [Prosthecobacter sp.]MDZ4401766.1 YihY/virulence factor BrkB family protein [Prosthecobacter sp.]